MRDPNLDIRRPDLVGVRRTGTVRWWKSEKGYGRITADDGEVLFAHFRGVVGERFRELTEGQRVSFVWNGCEAATDGTAPTTCVSRRQLRPSP